MRAEKRAVAGNSVLAAIAITTLKIVVGLTTGSLGILSEAAHSGLDLIAAIVMARWRISRHLSRLACCC
jgi:divalent metal cation (Fe/Co/Zn/Cd) transporter